MLTKLICKVKPIHIIAIILYIITFFIKSSFPELTKGMIVVWFFLILIWIYKDPYSGKNTLIKFIIFVFLLTNFLPFIQPTQYSYLVFILGHLLFLYFIIKGNFKSQIKPALNKTDFIFLLALLLSLWILLFFPLNVNDISQSTSESTQSLINGINPYTLPETTAIHQQHFMYGPTMLYSHIPFVLVFGTTVGITLASIVGIFLLLFLIYKIILTVTKDSTLARSGTIIFAFFPITFWELFIVLTNDSVVLFFLLLGTFFVLTKNYLKSGLVLTFGVAAKLIPIIPLTILIIGLFKKDKRDTIRSTAIFLILLILLISPFVILNFNEFGKDMTHQAKRELSDWEKPISLQYIVLEFTSSLIQLVFVSIFFIILFLKSKNILDPKKFLLFATIGSIIFNIFIRTYHQNYFLFPFVFMIIYLMILEKETNPNKKIISFEKKIIKKINYLFEDDKDE
jgi:hypothetical protein